VQMNHLLQGDGSLENSYFLNSSCESGEWAIPEVSDAFDGLVMRLYQLRKLFSRVIPPKTRRLSVGQPLRICALLGILFSTALAQWRPNEAEFALVPRP